MITSMEKKKRIGILFGGESAEHSVSLRSAQRVAAHLDPEKYAVVYLAIDVKGTWRVIESEAIEAVWDKPELFFQGSEKTFFSLGALSDHVDVMFPLLHGPLGEDGTVQGWAELAHLPYVGSGVLSSALCMDKGQTKQVLQAAGIPVGRYILLREGDPFSVEKITAQLGLPLFVKPANLGSSVGVAQVEAASDVSAAINEAFSFDRRILIEEAIEGRELECAVLGNAHPLASLPGELLPQHGFYSYEAKCVDTDKCLFSLPALLSSETREDIQRLAIQAFQELDCAGLARVDFFLTNDGQVLVNEVNTIPGFTPTSLYPKLWEISGIQLPQLCDQLIQLAYERFDQKKRRRQALPAGGVSR